MTASNFVRSSTPPKRSSAPLKRSSTSPKRSSTSPKRSSALLTRDIKWPKRRSIKQVKRAWQRKTSSRLWKKLFREQKKNYRPLKKSAWLQKAHSKSAATDQRRLEDEVKRLQDRFKVSNRARESAEAELTMLREAQDEALSTRARRQEQDAARIAELERELEACLAAPPTELTPMASAGPTAHATESIDALHALLTDRDARILKLEQELTALDKLAGDSLEPDDLKRIRGIGPVLEKLLNGTGVFTFRQIAAWDAADIAWAAAKLDAFTDRIERDEWVAQARVLYHEKLAAKDSS